MKRPWKLYGRRKSRISGAWLRWRIEGTFSTEAKAIAGMEKFKARWARNCLESEAYVGSRRGLETESVASDARRG